MKRAMANYRLAAPHTFNILQGLDRSLSKNKDETDRFGILAMTDAIHWPQETMESAFKP
jgi:hypothetical protein